MDGESFRAYVEQCLVPTLRRSASIRKLQRALITTVFDAVGDVSAKTCWALMPRARADKFGSARAAVKPRCFRGMHQKNRTRIGPHLAQPWAAERPAISVLEIGYVRRSEIRR
jgi:hypothetical protein